MQELPASLQHHRIRSDGVDNVVRGSVRFAPLKSLWFNGMGCAALIGGPSTFTWAALVVFLVSTGTVLLLGHSLGNHRKLIHDSFQCSRWLEYTLVYSGVHRARSGRTWPTSGCCRWRWRSWALRSRPRSRAPR